jgi:ketosteroid isomerase-like protein
MTYSVPSAVVDAFYQAYAVRDVKKVADFLHDEVQWSVSGPVDLLPFCGTWRGKQVVLDLIGRLVPGVIRVTSFVPYSMVIDGDQLAMLNRQTCLRADDGRVISFRVANFMRFRDDKVIHNISLLDSFDAVEQVLGHPLAVNESAGADTGDLATV